MKLFDFLLKKNEKEKNICNNKQKAIIGKKIIVGKYHNDLIYILNGELYCNNTIITVEEARKRESDYIGYQVYMDYAKGSATPEEAYSSRGYMKQDNIWVLKKYDIDKFLHLLKNREKSI